MWRALAFLALLAIAAFGATWIADRPGTVTVVWNGYEIATSLAIALIGVLVAAIAIGLVWAVVKGLITLPETLVRGSKERRRAKGFSALSRGMVAVGSGDPLAARRHANDAERLLGAEPLALLLKAQAAQISGDREAAEHAFQRMVNDPDTRVLGLRGLFVEARRREDDTAARAYATEAARLAPSVTWANEAVLEAQCADGDWSGAVETVERRASLGLIEKPLARRQRAVLLTAAAQTREAGEPEAAAQRALEAVKLAPDLVPAACIAGRLLARRGDLRKAAKIVETAWKAGPHPDLAKVYLGLRTGDSVRDRLARAETLAKLSSWHPEARLALAQAAVDGQDFTKAREALMPLLNERPTVRACLAMAKIEETEHGPGSGRAREWLARAAHAPRDPMWIADGIASERWAPLSPITGHLDAFVWKAPTELLEGPSGNDVTGDLDDRDDRDCSVIVAATHAATSSHPASNTSSVASPKAGEPVSVDAAAMLSMSTAPSGGPLAAGTATPVVFPPPKSADRASEAKTRLVS